MTFARYVLVQLVVYAIDLGTFELLIHLGGAPVVANLAGKAPAGLFAFLAHRAFTFGVRGRDGIRGQAVRYVALLLLHAPLSSLLMVGLLTATRHVTLAKIGGDVLAVGLTFMLTRHVVFGAALGARDAPDDQAR